MCALLEPFLWPYFSRNEKVTEDHWRSYVREAVEAARSLLEVCGSRGPSRRGHLPYIVAFVDELVGKSVPTIHAWRMLSPLDFSACRILRLRQCCQ